MLSDLCTDLLMRSLRRALAACDLPTVERAAGALGLLAFHLGIRRRVVQRNLRTVFPQGLSAPQRRAIGRRCYSSMGATFLGLLWSGSHPQQARLQVQVAAPLHLQTMVREYPGAVWLTAHLGNWDLAGTTIAHAVGQCQVYATPQHNARADEYINAMRQALGLEVVLAAHGDRRGAVRVIKGLRNGAPVGLLADQGPPPSRGVGAWFLGQAVSCHQGPEFFARHCRVPVIPGVALRRRAGVYCFYHGRVQWPSEHHGELTQRGLDLLSAVIAAAPGQYFWHHRRFKYPLPAPERSRQPWRQEGLRLWLAATTAEE